MASTGPLLLSDGQVHLEPLPDSTEMSWQVARSGSLDPIGQLHLVTGTPGERIEVRFELAKSEDSPALSAMAAAIRLACTWAFHQLRAPAVFWLGPADVTLRTVVFRAGFRIHPLPQRGAWPAPSGPTDAWFADLTPADLTHEPAASLTAREHQVLAHMARGRSNAQIAEQLGISENTVKNHVRAILDHLQAPSRTAAVVLALQTGLASVDYSTVHDR